MAEGEGVAEANCVGSCGDEHPTITITTTTKLKWTGLTRDTTAFMGTLISLEINSNGLPQSASERYKVTAHPAASSSKRGFRMRESTGLSTEWNGSNRPRRKPPTEDRRIEPIRSFNIDVVLVFGDAQGIPQECRGFCSAGLSVHKNGWEVDQERL